MDYHRTVHCASTLLLAALLAPVSPPASQPTLGVPASVAEVDRLLAAHPNYLQHLDAQDLSALSRACHRGDLPVITRLLNAGAPIEGLPGESFTPLLALTAGAMEDSFRRGAVPATADRATRETSNLASRRQQEGKTRNDPRPDGRPAQYLDAARLLLARGAAVDARPSPKHHTPLFAAVCATREDLVALLLSHKASPNAVINTPNMTLRTPLAAAAPFADITKLMLDHGGIPERADAESHGGAYLRTVMHHPDTVKVLLDHGWEPDERALPAAAASGRPNSIKLLVARNHTQNADAALVRAVKSSRTHPDEDSKTSDTDLAAITAALLTAGASPSAPDNTGEAYALALSRGHTQTATLLEGKGAKIDWPRLTEKEIDPERLTYNAFITNRPAPIEALEKTGMPLGPFAATYLGRDTRLAKLLKQHPALIQNGNLLVIAAYRGHTSTVKTLLDAGANPNERMPSWDTPDIGPRPLTAAALAGHLPIVELLLSKGADPVLLTFDENEWNRIPPNLQALLKPARIRR